MAHRSDDLRFGVKDTVVRHDHFFICIDVDYYLDLPLYLSYGAPVLLYTLFPNACGGGSADTTFSFNEDSEVVMRVMGGAEYKHRVWNHSHDHVSVVSKWGTLISYSVESVIMETDPHRRIVLYTPETMVPWPYWHGTVAAPRLERLRVTHIVEGQPVNAMRVAGCHGDGGDTLSISPCGQAWEVRIPESAAYNVASAYNEGKVSISTVKRLVDSALRSHEPDAEAREKQSVKSAALIANLLRGGVKDLDVIKGTSALFLRSGGPGKADHYQAIAPTDPYEIGKEYARRLTARPTSLEAVFPSECRANDVWTVEERIDLMSNTTPFPRHVRRWANEFVAAVVPPHAANVGQPMTVEEVAMQQMKPLQKVRNRHEVPLAGLPEDRGATVLSMQKKESYVETKPPRNISTLTADHNLRLGGFARAFKAERKDAIPWFNIGDAPAATANRLRDIGKHGFDLIETDYSRFDGRVSKDMKTLVADACMLRWCHPCNRDELRRLLDEERDATARTRNGVRYNTGSSRLSGSAITSDHNTLINGFILYISFRGLSMDHDSAWRSLTKYGICHGDDGILAAVKPSLDISIQRACKAIGMEVKIVRRQAGTPIFYLGRVWPDLTSTSSSMADPPRTLSHLHLTIAPESVPDDVAARNRARAYLVTDRLTPVVRGWAAAVLRVAPLNEWRRSAEDGMMTSEESHRSTGGAWVQHDSDIELLESTFCALLGVTDAELRHAEDELASAASLDAFPEEPLQVLNGETKATRDLLIGGELHEVCQAREQSANGGESRKSRSPQNRSENTTQRPAAQPGKGGKGGGRQSKPPTKGFPNPGGGEDRRRKSSWNGGVHGSSESAGRARGDVPKGRPANRTGGSLRDVADSRKVTHGVGAPVKAGRGHRGTPVERDGPRSAMDGRHSRDVGSYSSRRNDEHNPHSHPKSENRPASGLRGASGLSNLGGNTRRGEQRDTTNARVHQDDVQHRTDSPTRSDGSSKAHSSHRRGRRGRRRSKERNAPGQPNPRTHGEGDGYLQSA
jgi:hypothetical protein